MQTTRSMQELLDDLEEEDFRSDIGFSVKFKQFLPRTCCLDSRSVIYEPLVLVMNKADIALLNVANLNGQKISKDKLAICTQIIFARDDYVCISRLIKKN